VREEYLRDKEKRRLEFWQEFQQKCDEIDLKGTKPNKSASHSVYVFETRSRPATVRPTVHYTSPPMNMIKFYGNTKNMLRNDDKKNKLTQTIEEVISQSDTSVTTEITDSLNTDIDDNNDFDKLIIENESIDHNKFKEVEETLEWMLDTTRILEKTLIKLSEDEIDAEPR
jgi:hypothetical protein